jgi:hypothetical protein
VLPRDVCRNRASFAHKLAMNRGKTTRFTPNGRVLTRLLNAVRVVRVLDTGIMGKPIVYTALKVRVDSSIIVSLSASRA